MSVARSRSGSPSQSFDRFAQIVKDEIGVRLPQNKQIMVESRLRRRMDQLEIDSVDGYFRYLFDDNGLNDELDVIFDAVTTNKTDFFRERDHFERLAEIIIPDRLRVRKAAGLGSMVKIWSAASSSGMEAYTAAMVLAECAARSGPFEWGILGTDINLKMLDQARRAIYSSAEIAPVPQELRARHLMQGTGSHSDDWRIAPELRRRVRFQQVNLMDDSYPMDRDIDVIFLRNVLIYFDANDQMRVIERMADHLAPGGHLIVGHSESMIVRQPDLTQIAPGVYCKD